MEGNPSMSDLRVHPFSSHPTGTSSRDSDRDRVLESLSRVRRLGPLSKGPGLTPHWGR